MGSWIDVILVLMLVTGITVGFYQGLLRQAFLLLAIYIGTVLSAQYYGHVSSLLVRAFPSSSIDMANVVSFLFLLATFTIVISWLIFTGFKETRLPSLVIMDNVGGASLGGVFGLFSISLTLMIAAYSLQIPWPDGSPVKYALSVGLSNSELSGLFSTPLPIIQSALKPWLPGNVPFIS